MSRILLCSLVAVGLMACATTSTTGEGHAWWHGSISVENDSNYNINHIFLTPAHAAHWGPDQLGNEILEPTHTITLAGLECENYDLKLIDHEGDECVVEDVNLCLEDAHWRITDHELSACTGFHK